MKLEAGKSYRDRSGNHYGPLREDDFGLFTFNNITWYKNGRVTTEEETFQDLIEEALPIPRTRLCVAHMPLTNDDETYIPYITDLISEDQVGVDEVKLNLFLVFEGSPEYELVKAALQNPSA